MAPRPSDVHIRSTPDREKYDNFAKVLEDYFERTGSTAEEDGLVLKEVFETVFRLPEHGVRTGRGLKRTVSGWGATLRPT
jgi:hypothetical protein